MRYFFWLVIFYLSIDSVEARVYDIYRADDTKGAFCSAVAGACASEDDQEAAYYQNPASLTAGDPTFSFDGDYNSSSNVEPGMRESNQVSEKTYMGGFGISGKRMGLGVAVSGKETNVQSSSVLTDENGVPKNVKLTSSASLWHVNIPIAWRLGSGFAFGVSVRGLFFRQSFNASTGESSTTKHNGFPIPSYAIGGIINSGHNFRFGFWGQAPLVYYSKIKITFNSLGNTINYSEDIALYQPWMAVMGFSLMPWSDARTLTMDWSIIGASPNAFLLSYDTFSASVNDTSLRAKGRAIAHEPRIGYRTPWYKNSNGTLFLGSYLEAARTEKVKKRIHGTLGLSYKIGSFLEFLTAVDVSRDFFQLFISLR